ncbi:MAG: type II secretion system protein [Candidatus Kerfeldbacteria bacterium]|nr:type II secretion system protein [Candidatus Kerfeldbacteria bacterium]
MNKKGFTLVELLVVIAIIGLLATLAFVSLNSARAKARDAKRVSDVRQIQSALELYYNNQVIPGYPDNPAGADFIVSSAASWAGFIPGTTLPTPPGADDCTNGTITPADADLTNYSGQQYYYKGFQQNATSAASPLPGHDETDLCNDGDTGCGGYEITYCLGGATGGISQGVNTAYEAGIDGGA